MVKALSFDLRVRVLAAAAGGMSHREAAQMFAVSPLSPCRSPQGLDPGPSGRDT
jgi:hypothetical protein